MSVSNSSSGRHWELDQVPAVGDPTHIVQLRTGDRVSAREVNGVWPSNDAWLRATLYVERQGTTNTESYLMGGVVSPGPDARVRLRFFDFASAQSRILADLGERLGLGLGFGLGVSPDGRTILFTRADNPSSDLMMVESFR